MDCERSGSWATFQCLLAIFNPQCAFQVGSCPGRPRKGSPWPFRLRSDRPQQGRPCSVRSGIHNCPIKWIFCKKQKSFGVTEKWTQTFDSCQLITKTWNFMSGIGVTLNWLGERSGSWWPLASHFSMSARYLWTPLCRECPPHQAELIRLPALDT